jgi:hypothetical protein
MFKLILVFFIFCVAVASINPTPSVEQLTEVNRIYCKDICK